MEKAKRRLGAAAAVVAAGLGTAALASETVTYTYDPLGRLVVAKSTGTVNDNQTHSTCYDKAGNRVVYNSNQTGTPASCVNSQGN